MNYSSPKQIGDHNKYQMISFLRERGQISRVELSRLLGISATAVTRNITTLLETGIIRECGAERSTMGRKPVLLELCRDFCYVIGVDVVGGVIKVALADLMGDIVRMNTAPIMQNKSGDSIFDQLIALLKNTIGSSGVPVEKIKFITVGTSGVFNPELGKSELSLFHDGWADINIREEISARLGIETLVDNDVNLDVIGESWKGVGRNFDSILYVKLGEGLASRIVLGDGRLMRGEHNLAGEIGYMMPSCAGSTVNFENMLRNTAMCQRYKTAIGESSDTEYTITDLLKKRQDGDKVAGEVIGFLLENLWVVLLNSASVLDPQVIILGGDACNFEKVDVAFLKNKLEACLPLNQNIILSKLEKQGCLYGAIKIGLDEVEKGIMEG